MAGRAQPLGTSSSLLLVSQMAHWFVLIVSSHRTATIAIAIIRILSSSPSPSSATTAARRK